MSCMDVQSKPLYPRFGVGEVLKLRSVIRRYRLEYLSKAIAILLMELLHRLADASAVSARNLNGNIVIRDTFYHGEDNGFLALALPDDSVCFPVTELLVFINNGRAFINAAPKHALVLAVPFAVLLA